MPRKLILAVVILLAAATTLAGTRKYKTWIDTPEAYFLTTSEREEWAKVSSDQEAEEFVLRYFEKRGAPFKEELAHRIELADKYFTMGKKRGSETLRGKMVILFGAPSKIERERRTRESSFELSAAAGNVSNASPMGSNSAAIRVHATIHTLTWTGDRVPKPLAEPIVIRIEFDFDGRERLAGTEKDQKRLSELFETIAAASRSSSPSR